MARRGRSNMRAKSVLDSNRLISKNKNFIPGAGKKNTDFLLKKHSRKK